MPVHIRSHRDSMRKTPFLWLAASLFLLLPVAAVERVALVASQDSKQMEAAIDLALVELSRQEGLVVLERNQARRLLAEQALDLEKGVSGRDAVQAGHILAADLFVVVRPYPGKPDVNVAIVFDACVGLRVVDVTLPQGAPAAGKALAEITREAVGKRDQVKPGLQAVTVADVVNSDLPASYNTWCQSIGLLLERSMLRAPSIVVPEREHLELLHREDCLVGESKGRDLASSLVHAALEFRRGKAVGEVRALLLLSDIGGRAREVFEIDGTLDDPGALHAKLEKQLLAALKQRPAAPMNRALEAKRLKAESERCHRFGDTAGARRHLEAALALQPDSDSLQSALCARLTPSTSFLDSKAPEYRLAVLETLVRVGNIQQRRRQRNLKRFHYWWGNSSMSGALAWVNNPKCPPDERAVGEDLRKLAESELRDRLRYWREHIEPGEMDVFRTVPLGVNYLVGYAARVFRTPESYWGFMQEVGECFFALHAQSALVHNTGGDDHLVKSARNLLPWPGRPHLGSNTALAVHAQCRDWIDDLRHHHPHPVVAAYAEAVHLEGAVARGDLTTDGRALALTSLRDRVHALADEPGDFPPAQWAIDCLDFVSAVQGGWPDVFPEDGHVQVAARRKAAVPTGHFEEFWKEMEILPTMRIAATQDVAMARQSLYTKGALPGVGRVVGWHLHGNSLLGAGVTAGGLVLVEVPLDGGAPRTVSRRPAALPEGAKFPGANYFQQRYLDRNLRAEAWTMSDDRWVHYRSDFEAGASDAVYALGVSGVGLLWFPRDGRDGRWFRETDGLPSRSVTGVAVLGAQVYVGLPNHVVRLNFPEGRPETLVAAKRLVPETSLDGKGTFRPTFLRADPERHRVLFQARGAHNGSAVGRGVYALQAKFDSVQRAINLSGPNLDFVWMGPVQNDRIAMWGHGMFRGNCGIEYALDTGEMHQWHSTRSTYHSHDFSAKRSVSQIPLAGVSFPFLIRDGWLWSGLPLTRTRLDGERKEIFHEPGNPGRGVRMDSGLWHHPEGDGIVMASEHEVVVWREKE